MNRTRIRRPVFVLVSVLLLLLLFCGCGAGKNTETQYYTSLEELEHKRIGVSTGSIQAAQVAERLPDAELYYFSTSVDCLEAMRAGKVDAFADAEALVKYMMAENPDLTYIEEALSGEMKAGAAFPKTDRGRKLCNQYSEYLVGIKQNGVYDEIQSIWYGSDESKRVVPDLYNLSGPNGTLRVAADTSMIPLPTSRTGRSSVSMWIRWSVSAKSTAIKSRLSPWISPGFFPRSPPASATLHAAASP